MVNGNRDCTISTGGSFCIKESLNLICSMVSSTSLGSILTGQMPSSVSSIVFFLTNLTISKGPFLPYSLFDVIRVSLFLQWCIFIFYALCYLPSVEKSWWKGDGYLTRVEIIKSPLFESKCRRCHLWVRDAGLVNARATRFPGQQIWGSTRKNLGSRLMMCLWCCWSCLERECIWESLFKIEI